MAYQQAATSHSSVPPRSRHGSRCGSAGTSHHEPRQPHNQLGNVRNKHQHDAEDQHERYELPREPNDWNLGRRAWEAGVRFHFVDRETVTLRVHPRGEELRAEYEALGLPFEAAAYP